MVKWINRWMLLALLSAVYGAAGLYTGRVTARNQVTEAQKQRWRDYAGAVQRGERSPSPELVQALTNTAIADAEAMAALADVMKWIGGCTLAIGLILTLHLSRAGVPKRQPAAEAA